MIQIEPSPQCHPPQRTNSRFEIVFLLVTMTSRLIVHAKRKEWRSAQPLKLIVILVTPERSLWKTSWWKPHRSGVHSFTRFHRAKGVVAFRQDYIQHYGILEFTFRFHFELNPMTEAIMVKCTKPPRYFSTYCWPWGRSLGFKNDTIPRANAWVVWISDKLSFMHITKDSSQWQSFYRTMKPHRYGICTLIRKEKGQCK